MTLEFNLGLFFVFLFFLKNPLHTNEIQMTVFKMSGTYSKCDQTKGEQIKWK